jgi:S-adenosylmethionine decarboxylase proenzyme
MHGLHLTADLLDCRCAPALLRDAAQLQRLCRTEVAASGLQAVNDLFHRFEGEAGGGGVTGVVLLAESHLALHTWPELRGATLDVYVCNFSADNGDAAERLLQRLVDAFAPGRCERQRLTRGTLAR